MTRVEDCITIIAVAAVQTDDLTALLSFFTDAVIQQGPSAPQSSSLTYLT